MGRFLFLLISWCLLLPASPAAAQASNKTYYLASVSDNHPGAPKFMEGLYMDEHHRKVIFRNVVDIKKPVERNTAEPILPAELKNMATIDSLEEKEPVSINKNETPEKDIIPAPIKETPEKEIATEPAKKAEPTENTATLPVAITKPAKTRVNEIKTARNEDIHSVDEVVVDLQEDEIDPVIKRYAGMIEVDPSDITNYPLYRFIDKWYGTDYKWGGNDSTGIDCSAFSQKLYGSVYGIDLLRTAREQHKKSERFKHSDEATEGDLIFFRVRRFRISHVGVYLANGYFVHASRSHGVAISNLDSRYWRKRYAGCGRMQRIEGPSESDSLQ